MVTVLFSNFLGSILTHRKSNHPSSHFRPGALRTVKQERERNHRWDWIRLVWKSTTTWSCHHHHPVHDCLQVQGPVCSLSNRQLLCVVRKRGRGVGSWGPLLKPAASVGGPSAHVQIRAQSPGLSNPQGTANIAPPS